jgi:hypothetical protein
MRNRKMLVTIIFAAALILVAAGSTLAVLYAGTDTVEAATASSTATSLCEPAPCAQQGLCAGQNGAAGACKGFTDADGDGVCDYRGDCSKGGSCPGAGNAQCGNGAARGPAARGGCCSGASGR